MTTAGPVPFVFAKPPCAGRQLARACISALLLATTLAVAAPGAVVTTPQVRAELVAHAPEGLQPGAPLWLGLKIEHKPHWHTYWKNPGDSGLPTTLTWQLPAGVQAQDIEWPTPSRLPIGPLMNYGYEGTLLLPVAVKLPAAWAGEHLDVKLQAQWLVCKDVCIPEEGEFALSVPARTAVAAHAELFASTRQRMPQAVAGVSGTAEVQGQHLVFKLLGLPAAWQGQTLSLFPELAGVINNAAAVQSQWQGSTWTGRVALDPQRTEAPSNMAVVWTQPGLAAGLRAEVPVTTPWPAVAAAPAAPAAATPEPSDKPADSGSAAAPVSLLGWLGAMVLAMAGGALLNLMPCVFPVLSLKVLGFTSQAQDRRALLAGGLAYTAGVVLSFVALAALMLALRAGGEQIGWGFQLQSPVVVAVLAALFTLIGLNLVGLFEMGQVLPSGLAALRSRHPLADSALTGVLAVAVASPCTAPFMGAALGLSLSLPAWQALTVFAALGLGMALPYLAASAWPALARALPRPGVWMDHFKTLMAFPMWATVVWLVWVLGHQVGIDGAAALLVVLLALAFLAWALGSRQLGPMGRRGFGAAAVLALLAAAAWAWPMMQVAPAGATAAASGTGDDGWQAWSPATLQQAQASGRPVFVDYTAAWCVTCQVNKRTTLSNAEVKAAFAARQVVLLRADWTRRDAAISAELTRLQRSGVPVYALYAPGAAQPQLLPELLTVAAVQQALSTLPASR